MRIAETVTFGGSGLDRAAHLRGDMTALAQLKMAGLVLAVWRGKLPISLHGGLEWLPSDHPALTTGLPPVFLGLQDGRAIFAQDISVWEPDLTVQSTGFFDEARQRHPDLNEGVAFGDLRAVMTSLTAREAELAATARALCDWHARHHYCSACGARSEPQQAGWQRGCTTCDAKHFPRTDPVVIMLVTLGNSVLVGRSPGWPEGMYSLLAGFVEPGETLEAAVRREVFEEAGIRVGAVRYLASQPWPFPASLMLGCCAEASSAEITIDPVELDDAIWISREEMIRVLAGAHPVLRPPRRGAIAEFLIRNWLADRLD